MHRRNIVITDGEKNPVKHRFCILNVMSGPKTKIINNCYSYTCCTQLQ